MCNNNVEFPKEERSEEEIRQDSLAALYERSGIDPRLAADVDPRPSDVIASEEFDKMKEEEKENEDS